MSEYILSITDCHGIRDIHIIKAQSDAKVADYIKSHVSELYDPYFDYIVNIGTDTENKLAVYLNYKVHNSGDFDVDDDHDQKEIIKIISKFLNKHNTEDILDIMTVYENSGNKEDGVMRIKRPTDEGYTCKYVDLTKKKI